MTLRVHAKIRPITALLAPAALGIFYWGLFQSRAPEAEGGMLSPAKSRLLQEESALMRRYGRWDRALPPTLQLHTAYPENHIYIGQLAEIYDHLGRYGDAAGMWEEFLVHAPRPIEACPQIGQVYEKQGLEKQAIGSLERCLALEPNNPDSIFFLAHALERDGDLSRAAALYERGVALSPQYLDLQIGLARVRLRQGKAEEAKALATGVVSGSPNNVDALLVLGLASVRLGERADAKRYLTRGSQLADAYADFHIALAQIAEQDANLEQAIQQYQKAAKLDKTNAEVAQRLALLERARP